MLICMTPVFDVKKSSSLFSLPGYRRHFELLIFQMRKKSNQNHVQKALQNILTTLTSRSKCSLLTKVSYYPPPISLQHRKRCKSTKRRETGEKFAWSVLPPGGKKSLLSPEIKELHYVTSTVFARHHQTWSLWSFEHSHCTPYHRENIDPVSLFGHMSHTAFSSRRIVHMLIYLLQLSLVSKNAITFVSCLFRMFVLYMDI